MFRMLLLVIITLNYCEEIFSGFVLFIKNVLSLHKFNHQIKVQK
jgi:hypothetical protein